MSSNTQLKSVEEKANSRQPLDSDFQQQRLKAWQPLLTPNWVIATFAIIGAIFLILGGIIVGTTSNVHEIVARYDQLSVAGCDRNTTNGNCAHPLNVNIDKDMDGPVYLYYRLTNYYQNHRRYVKSRSDPQLQGDPAQSTSCDPLQNNDINGKTLYPCGLIANSFFNDTFSATLFPVSGSPILLGNGTSNNTGNPDFQKDGIAWDSDIKKKFIYRDPPASVTRISSDGVQLPRVDDEDFIVWMRTAGLPTFKKLYRKINRSFKKGDQIQFWINNVYPVDSFDGEKAIVLSTTSWLGGKNLFLGYAYIAVGATCILVALAFLAKAKISPRKLGDLSHFRWNTAPTAPKLR